MFAGLNRPFMFVALIVAGCGAEPVGILDDNRVESELVQQEVLSRKQLERLARRHLIEHMGNANAMAADRAPGVTVLWNGAPLNADQVFAQDSMFFGAFPDIHAANEQVLAIDENRRTVTLVVSYDGTWTGPFFLPDGTMLQPPSPAPFVSSPSTVVVTFKPNGKVIRSIMNYDTLPLLRTLGLVH